MSLRELIQRYAIFTFGMILVAAGVSVMSKSMLGISPISAIPLGLFIAFPQLTLGNWTIIINVLLALVQIFILKKSLKKIELGIQLVVTIPFGYIIDWCNILIADLEPVSYAAKMIVLIIGCLIVALGVYFQFVGGVAMLPGDAFIRAIGIAYDKDPSNVRIVSDISMTAIAFAIVLIFTGGFGGMREGTIVAAVVIGNSLKVFEKILRPVRTLLLRGCKYY